MQKVQIRRTIQSHQGLRELFLHIKTVEEKKHKKEENARLIEEGLEKQQEAKVLKKEEKARLIEERKQKKIRCRKAKKPQLAEMRKLDKEKGKGNQGN